MENTAEILVNVRVKIVDSSLVQEVCDAFTNMTCEGRNLGERLKKAAYFDAETMELHFLLNFASREEYQSFLADPVWQNETSAKLYEYARRKDISISTHYLEPWTKGGSI